LTDSKQLLALGASEVHGFDFSYQGVLGIWEGFAAQATQDSIVDPDGKEVSNPLQAFSQFPADAQVIVDTITSSIRARQASRQRSHSPMDAYHGNYQAALVAMTSRRDVDKSSWKHSIQTNKVHHRRLALALCNWTVTEEDFKQ
jgi:hypothetical protein